ncbi:hypothetical protein E3N88_17771 [Mikania micrantha]|uniref:Transposase-associated domain-containing protein n=1 Tax=Mikania micrantha TaxID=192012 RepID=A0A5N6NV07_9ASTR|nr:hypothetical protein E3N88_17771 [Mikania micrantha]
MTLDKSWTKITNKVDPKFIKGAIAFAERGETYIDSEGRIHCPCRKCVNARKHVPKVVGYHIIHNGFESSYNVWLHHGEHLPGYETDDTRRSHEPNSRQPRIQTVVNGSTSEVISHPTRKRIRRLADNEVTGAKISLTLSSDTKGFVGNSATQFATECGITIRNYCPMNYHTWESVPDDVKNMLYEKLQGRFNLLRSDRVFMEHVNARLHAQWKRTRGTLSAYWKKNGGKTNPHLARSKMMPNCRNQEDWNHLCDYWELEKTRKYNDQMEANRGKQVITSRGGSRSISNHRFHLVMFSRKCEKKRECSDQDVWDEDEGDELAGGDECWQDVWADEDDVSAQV